MEEPRKNAQMTRSVIPSLLDTFASIEREENVLLGGQAFTVEGNEGGGNT